MFETVRNFRVKGFLPVNPSRNPPAAIANQLIPNQFRSKGLTGGT